jgi:formamidopyrimidine-DNA glycosylase
VPELPEVEAARVLAETVAVGRRIVTVRCARDPIVFEGRSPEQMRRALIGRRVMATGRHGKHLWLELDGRPWPAFHFGMAGGLAAPERVGLQLVSGGERRGDEGWPPRFTKLQLHFDDGGQLAMTDARRLGRIRLREDPRAEPPMSLLGFDALLELPAPSRFQRLLAERSAPIKAVLLDQSFAAGVGNWIADEVLYQAGVAPRRRASSLDEAEACRLRGALRSVLRTAVAAGANDERFPRTWLFHHRWGRTAGARTARGERIRHDTIAGRTTAWVPSVQR